MFSFCLGRFVTPDELDSLILYLKDKRARLLRSAADPLTGERKDALKLGSCVSLVQSRAKIFIYQVCLQCIKF